MKLYTEEQLETAILETFFDCKITTHQRYKSYERIESDILKQLTPIKLPSDEEIRNESMEFYDNNGADIYFTQGAKWVIEQIKKQDK